MRTEANQQMGIVQQQHLLDAGAEEEGHCLCWPSREFVFADTESGVGGGGGERRVRCILRLSAGLCVCCRRLLLLLLDVMRAQESREKGHQPLCCAHIHARSITLAGAKKVRVNIKVTKLNIPLCRGWVCVGIR